MPSRHYRALIHSLPQFRAIGCMHATTWISNNSTSQRVFCSIPRKILQHLLFLFHLLNYVFFYLFPSLVFNKQGYEKLQQFILEVDYKKCIKVVCRSVKSCNRWEIWKEIAKENIWLVKLQHLFVSVIKMRKNVCASERNRMRDCKKCQRRCLTSRIRSLPRAPRLDTVKETPCGVFHFHFFCLIRRIRAIVRVTES